MSLREGANLKTRTKVFLGLAAAVVLLLGLGLVGGMLADDGTKSVRGPNAIPPTPTALPGNATRVGDLLLIVNGVGPYADDLFPVESGTHYVAVDITAMNTGDKTYSLNVFNFHLKDSDKFTGQVALTSGPDPKIGASDMVPGQEVRGFIVFKIGDTRTPVELQYQSFTGSATTIALR